MVCIFYKATRWLKKTVFYIKKDIGDFSIKNTCETRVEEAKYFAGYKGTVVVKTPFSSSFSFCRLIGIGSNVHFRRTLAHEYGHFLQCGLRGVGDYAFRVAIPSVTINLLNRFGKLPYDYYGAPWEAEADILGGVVRENITGWPEEESNSYLKLLKLWFIKRS